MRCELVAYNNAKDGKSTFRCITHEWVILHAIEPGYRCPIGEIEKRADDALSLIQCETNQVIRDAVQEVRQILKEGD